MTYFSRLTEIVTCNIQSLLTEAVDPIAALREIIREMEEGVAGARRSCQTAGNNEQRLNGEIDAHRTQIALWSARAKEELGRNQDALARQALLRKRELEDVIAALQQQLQAATATREQLQTTLRALEVRLADAKRKEAELSSKTAMTDTELMETRPATVRAVVLDVSIDERRAAEIDDELAALRRELGN